MQKSLKYQAYLEYLTAFVLLFSYKKKTHWVFKKYASLF